MLCEFHHLSYRRGDTPSHQLIVSTIQDQMPDDRIKPETRGSSLKPSCSIHQIVSTLQVIGMKVQRVSKRAKRLRQTGKGD